MTENRSMQGVKSLDGLPVELKLCILQQLPNLSSIHALARASPKYFQTYLQYRSQVLYDILLRQYNGEVDIYEAAVAMRSDGVLAEIVNNRDTIMDLLDYRRRGAKESKIRFKAESFTTDEIMKMMKMHESAVYFVEDYGATLPEPSWWAYGSGGKWESPIKFSPTERARFFRAYYRFQTWCHIFGQPEYGSHFPSSTPSDREPPPENQWTDRTFTLEQAWRLIWGTMPPWEIEEVGSLVDYFMSKYVEVFNEMTTTVVNGIGSSNSAEDDDRASSEYTPIVTTVLAELVVSTFEMGGNPWSIATSFRYSMIETGPFFLYKILHQPFNERHVAVSRNLRDVFTTKLWEVTGLKDDKKLPLISPADRYQRPNLPQFLNSLPALERPNKAWIRHWADSGGIVHPGLWLRDDLFSDNDYPTQNRLEWKWGYVLWDDDRLEQWNAMYLSANY